MALYFFDIHDGEALPDHQGLEFADLAGAQAYALKIAASYLTQDPARFWKDHAWQISIRDAAGNELYRMEFKLTQPVMRTDWQVSH